MSAKRHPGWTLGEFVLAVSSLTVLVVQVAGARLAQTGAGTGSIELPHFDRALLLEATSETSANVSIGDVNGDGNLDIVLAKGRHWPLVDRVLLNDGHGRFPSRTTLARRLTDRIPRRLSTSTATEISMWSSAMMRLIRSSCT